jgi:hypothetical protein
MTYRRARKIAARFFAFGLAFVMGALLFAAARNEGHDLGSLFSFFVALFGAVLIGVSVVFALLSLFYPRPID